MWGVLFFFSCSVVWVVPYQSIFNDFVEVMTNFRLAYSRRKERLEVWRTKENYGWRLVNRLFFGVAGRLDV